MKRAGVSLPELLVVLAVLGILLAVAVTLAQPSNGRRAAQALRSAVLWARANAIWQGASVSVTELDGGAGFVVRTAVPHEPLCSGGAELVRVNLREHPGVTVQDGLPRGLVWLPNGSGRSCDGGGVISATVRLQDARGAYHVVISSLGRVRVEATP